MFDIFLLVKCPVPHTCFIIFGECSHFTHYISLLTNTPMLFAIISSILAMSACLLTVGLCGVNGGGLDDSGDSVLDTGPGTYQPLQIFILSVVGLSPGGPNFL